MKKIIVLLVLLTITLVLFSQTDIYEGDVSGNWDLGGSPYIINGNITIPNGETLTIEPGVNIQYNGSFTLTVLGRLLAVGTQTDSIIFTGNGSSYSDNAGIYFNNVSTENDSSRFAYCKLQNFSGVAIKIKNTSKININFCEITNNHHGGILILSSSISIFNTKINENDFHDYSNNYRCSGISVYDSSLKLINCLIYKNNMFTYYSDSELGHGLYSGNGLYSSNSDIYLLNCTFADNTSYVDAYEIFYYGFNDIKITDQSNLHIINSIIWDMETIKSVVADNQSNIEVYNSNIQHFVNNPDNEDCILLHNQSTLYWDGSAINIDPLFIDSENSNYRLAETSPSIDSGTLDYPSDCEIPANDLEGNSRIFNDAFSKIDMGAYEYQGTPNTDSQIHLFPYALTWDTYYMFDPYVEKVFTIHNLGHESLNISQIISSDNFPIKENQDDEYTNTLSDITIPAMSWKDIFVEFAPQYSGMFNEHIQIYSDASNSNLVQFNVNGECLGGNHIGGNINEDTTWDADTLLVFDNITISENATLTIEPGTKILFTGPYYLQVLGNIIAEGDAENRIIFSKAGSSSWKGIRYMNMPENSDSSKFVYCNFEYASDDQSIYDGGFYINNFSKIKFEHCNFFNNIRINGGGLYIMDSDNITLNNCVFFQNRITGEKGGAIYIQNSHLNIINCDISNNIYSYMSEGSNYYGMGIYSINSELNIITSKIEHNGFDACYDDPIYYHLGGGLYADNSIVKIINSNISFNSTYQCNEVYYIDPSQQWGSGIYADDCDIDIINSDIASNNPYFSNLYFFNNTNASILNSVIWINHIYDTNRVLYIIENSSCQISYSDVLNGQNGINLSDNSTLQWLGTNISANPQFINVNSDLHISENSPLINAGIPDTTGLNIPAYDLDGNPRIDQGRIDIGCYEWQNNVNINDNNLQATNFIMHNYPNPFNPTTTIVYNPQKIKLKNAFIKIYNLKGELINSFDVSGNKASIVWNGVNKRDNKVYSGIYFYRLIIGGETKATNKCLLLK